MALTSQQFIELEGNINEVWDAYHKQKKDYISEIYNVIKKPQAQFTDFTVGAFGRMSEWQGQVAYDQFEKGYEKQYRPVKYSTGVQIDRDMWEDKEYERIKQRVSNAAYGVFKTLVYDGVEIFNKATSTEIVGADGQPLGSANHKTTPNAQTQSNLGTNDLTYDGLEASMLAMESFVDDRDDKMLIMGDMVIAGPQQRDNCKKLFGSDKEAYVGDNTANIYKDMSYMIHPLITGKRWFLVNRDLMKGGAGLNFFMRRDPRTLERDGALEKGDFNTEKLSWKAVGRWTKGFTNFFFAYVNNI
jgi:phage major head subunit gpT-like protein